MTVRRSPTVRRRRLGMELRRLRDAAGLTIEQVAKELECSDSKISRIETGHVGATPRDVRDLLALYSVSDEEREALVQLARETRQKGWWQAYSDVPISPYIGFESAAESIRAYDALVVPVLLQTARYADAITHVLRPDLSDEQVKRWVEFRIARQELLREDDPLALQVVLDEAALRRLVGGRKTMREQLYHIVETAKLPTVTIRVLPFKSGGHAGMDGAFAILHFPEPTDPEIVFLESRTRTIYVESAGEILPYVSAFDTLWDASLGSAESASFIVAMAKEL